MWVSHQESSTDTDNTLGGAFDLRLSDRFRPPFALLIITFRASVCKGRRDMGNGALSAVLGRQPLSGDLQGPVVTWGEVGSQQFLGSLLFTQGEIARTRT